MSEKILSEWIAALRSGKYPQGNGFLRYYSGGVIKYDWLGVLCDLYLNDNLLHWRKKPGKPTVYACWANETVVPQEVRKWAGWTRKFESFLTVLVLDVIKQHLTFEQIAWVLENYND